MAKPIRSTPELKGIEANNFLRKMADVEKSRISKVDKEILESIKKNSRFFKAVESPLLS